MSRSINDSTFFITIVNSTYVSPEKFSNDKRNISKKTCDKCHYSKHPQFIALKCAKCNILICVTCKKEYKNQYGIICKCKKRMTESFEVNRKLMTIYE